VSARSTERRCIEFVHLEKILLRRAQEVTMRQIIAPFPLLLVFAVSLAGCQIVGDIFKAGVWVGVIAVVGVIALVIWLISRMVS
jgi:hypothetical protein